MIFHLKMYLSPLSAVIFIVFASSLHAGSFKNISSGVGIVAKQVKLPTETQFDSAAPLPIQPPAEAHRQAAEDGPGAWMEFLALALALLCFSCCAPLMSKPRTEDRSLSLFAFQTNLKISLC